MSDLPDLTERQRGLLFLLADCVRVIAETERALGDVTRCLPKTAWLAARFSGTRRQLEQAVRQRLQARIERLQGDKAKILRALQRTEDVVGCTSAQRDAQAIG